MKVNCLSCGLSIHLDGAYDDYQGAIRCFACQAMLEIRAEDGQLKSVELARLRVSP